MQQLVPTCRALIHDPRLLLMDEPFGALDAMTREELWMQLLELWSVRRKTVVFVTHSITVAIALPRPRTIEMEFSEEFKGYTKLIRDAIADPRGRAA